MIRPGACTTALACLALAVVPWSDQLAFDRPAILAGEVFRLWTGHLVHFSARHGVLDASVLMLVGALVERAWGSRLTGAFLLLGMPVLSLGLLVLVPDLVEYRGLSGVAMSMAFAAGAIVWRSQPRRRIGLALLAFAALAKVILDAIGAAGSLSGLPPGIRVAWQAHVFGATLGLLASACRWRVRPLAEKPPGDETFEPASAGDQTVR